MRTAAKWGIRVVAVTFTLAVICWLVLYASQWQSRWRAERLYADINAMQVRQSSWADFQRFQAHWGSWAYYNGRCEPSGCLYRVLVDGLVAKVPDGDDFDASKFHLHKLLDQVGIRGTGAMAMVLFQDGIVAGKTFSLHSFSYNTGELDDFVADGPRLDSDDNDYLHVYHSVHQYKTYIFAAQMTPFEDKQKREKLMHFRFDCLTSLKPCSSHSEMLPDAYAEFERAKSLKKDAAAQQCRAPVWAMARDAEGVLLGDVLSAKREEGFSNDRLWDVRLKVRRVLKGKPEIPISFVDVGITTDLKPQDHDQQFPFRSLVVMGRIIAPDTEALQGPFEQNQCGATEASDANMKEVMRGIAADYAPYRPDLY